MIEKESQEKKEGNRIKSDSDYKIRKARFDREEK